MMNIDEVKKYFLSNPGAVMDMPFNIPVSVYKVGEKMFALINVHEPSRHSINLKYPKETIGELR